MLCVLSFKPIPHRYKQFLCGVACWNYFLTLIHLHELFCAASPTVWLQDTIREHDGTKPGNLNVTTRLQKQVPARNSP